VLVTEPQTEPQTDSPALPTRAPSWLDVIRAQRKVIIVGVSLMVACFWFIGQVGEWRTAALTAVGILLALLNHLASEHWLGKLISSGEQPSRGTIAASAFTRLAVLSVIAVGTAVVFWPNGVGLLLGLALFRLIALVMTSLPLLKELKKA
jgi:dipeptide/tripeptide permease